jgi:hypothetical protein
MPTLTPMLIRRALLLALAGALVGIVAIVAAYSQHARLTIDMERELPRTVSGFYPPERAGNDAFAWTAKRARVVLAGLDRRSPWRCAIRFRGARSPNLVQPLVQLEVDGVLASKVATNTYDTLDVIAPTRSGAPGLTLTITNSTAFEPGPSDKRELGIQVNQLTCEPIDTPLVLPPHGALLDAAIGATLFGAALGLVGIGTWPALAGVVLFAGLQVIPLSSGPAPYTSYVDRAMWLAMWTVAAIVVSVKALELARRRPLEATACAAIALSAAAFYLDMIGLLHPSKLPVDVVFHAHRFERVLSGWFYFTQNVRNTEFPYAIGLYVFAAPWAVLTHDHVTLLRIVVCASNALAGALLYPMIVRNWGDRSMGVTAVALFQCVPLPYTVIGNANLTNAFGQSAALVAIAAATTWRLGSKRPRQAELSVVSEPRGSKSGFASIREPEGWKLQDIAQVLALTLLCALALLSHVSTLASFTVTMFAMGSLCWLLGPPTLRAPARSILSALAIALVVSVVVYYGHFLSAYTSIARARMQTQTQTQTTAPTQPPPPTQPTQTTASTPPPPTPPTQTTASTPPPPTPPAQTTASTPPTSPGQATTPTTQRLIRGLTQSVSDIGWPILILAAAGVWHVWTRSRDRLLFALAAWGITYVVLFLSGALAPANRDFERYAVEFLSRVDQSVYPAAVILAAAGAVDLWRAALLPRIAAAALLLSASAIATRHWLQWFL